MSWFAFALFRPSLALARCSQCEVVTQAMSSVELLHRCYKYKGRGGPSVAPSRVTAAIPSGLSLTDDSQIGANLRSCGKPSATPPYAPPYAPPFG